MRKLKLIATLFMLLVGTTLKEGYAETVIGGEATYRDESLKSDLPAPGIGLYLISGVWKDPGLTEARIKDRDATADVRTGAEARDVGTFILHSTDKLPVVTVMYYPWPRDNKDPSMIPALLSRVIAPNPKETNGVLRARIRLNGTPTDATYSAPEKVADAVKQAYIAREFAREALDYGREPSQSNYIKELDLIASMIDQVRKAAIVDRTLEILSKDKSLESTIDEVRPRLTEDSDSVRMFRKMRLDHWKMLRQTDPLKRSFQQE